MDPIVATRLVFHIGGYDPMPPARIYGRFVRELHRFSRTWSATVSVTEAVLETNQAAWSVFTTGPNWRVTTCYRFMRWDDVMAEYGRQPVWQRIPLGLLAFFDFVIGGALCGYVRTNWRYALFFLYPYLLITSFTTLAWFTGAFVARTSDSVTVGIVTGIGTFITLLQGPGRWLYLPLAFDDWIFSRAYVRDCNRILDCRLDGVAGEIVAAARGATADEILIVGHSLGAVLAVDIVDRALRLEPDLGRASTRLALVTVGSSILKIGLHRGAVRFREALARVASAPNPFWAEYQSLTDLMNFYKTDPVAEAGLVPTGRPVVRLVRMRQMLNPVAYRRIRRNFYRVHCQFISGNDLRAPYDFFMMLCGPLTAERQARLPNGASSAIGEDGTLVAAFACEHPERREDQ